LDRTFFPRRDFKLIRDAVNAISRIESCGEAVGIETGA